MKILGKDRRRKCTICRLDFVPRKDAKTANTRTLCIHCRKIVNKEGKFPSF